MPRRKKTTSHRKGEHPLQDARQTLDDLREVARWQAGLIGRLDRALTRLERQVRPVRA